MRSPRVTSLALACTTLVAARAYADALTIETVEHGAWATSVAALQTDPRSEGTVLHVVVRDGEGRALRCGTYTLALDVAGARAFELGECAAASNSTPLVLAHRSALFDHGTDDTGQAPAPGGPSRPRAVLIVASRTESAGASGGAHVEAKSAVACSAEVTPYMPDLERGSRVPLRPGRYVLKPRQEDVRVTHDDTHWTLTREASEGATIDYDLVDALSAAIVLRDRVAVSCGSASRGAEPPTIVSAAHSDAPAAEAPAEATPEQPWEGHAWTVSARGGVAVLKAGGLVFGNNVTSVDAASLGVRDVAGMGTGIAFAYERPWLYTSLAFDFAYAGVADRSLYAIGGASVIAPSLRLGPLSAYAGPTVALTAYELSSAQSSHWEWGAKPDVGLGAAAGARLHFRDGATTWVLGFEASTPVAGRQPTFFLVSLGWGGGH